MRDPPLLAGADADSQDSDLINALPSHHYTVNPVGWRL